MPRTVAILLFDEVEVLDFAGPFEIFSVAGRRTLPEPPFHVVTVSADGGLVRARNDLRIVPHHRFADCPPADILVVPGGKGVVPLLEQPPVIDWISAQDARAELTASVCSGALLLGRAGLLGGLKATTHHLDYDDLEALVPTAEVYRGVRVVDNGRILTSAGVQAGMDLALHVVGKLLGVDEARETAAYIEYAYQPGRGVIA